MTYRPRQRPPISGRRLSDPLPEGLQRYRDNAEASIAVPFKGVTTDGTPIARPVPDPGDRRVDRSRSSRRPRAFLDSLEPRAGRAGTFPLDSRRLAALEQHPPVHDAPRRAARGPDADPARAGAWRWCGRASARAASDRRATSCGSTTRSARSPASGTSTASGSTGSASSARRRPTEPWGWQIDGHHLIVNCFVLGDQVVHDADVHGLRAGRGDDRQVRRHARLRGRGARRAWRSCSALDAEQRARGDRSATELPGDVFTDRPSATTSSLPYEGIRCGELTAGQQTQLLRADRDLRRPDPARPRRRASWRRCARHLDETRFAWIGGVRRTTASSTTASTARWS